jgi:DNA-binding response OmpR family regulator
MTSNGAARILILEDDDAILELLETVLSEEGYEIQTTRRAVQALRVAREWQPHVILFDISLPDQSGADFVKGYRELPDAQATLIAVSGIAHLEDAVAALGIHGYLTKPFDLDVLLGMVATVLGRAT